MYLFSASLDLGNPGVISQAREFLKKQAFLAGVCFQDGTCEKCVKALALQLKTDGHQDWNILCNTNGQQFEENTHF